MTQTQVLIVGAGPTGLVLALWLTKMGVAVRIVDKTMGPGTTSRALAVQARTLELYRQLDLSDAIVAAGHQVPAVNLWVRGRRKARVAFNDIGAGLTPYAFLEIFPQDAHEQLLVERLSALGVAVEREVEVTGFTDNGADIVAWLKRGGGEAEECRAAYIVGCDGAHSIVRETIGAAFPGGTYRQIFYVADVTAQGPALNGEFHMDLDDADFLGVFPLDGGSRARLIGTVRDARAESPGTLKFEDVSRRAIEHMKIEIEVVNWFSAYRVHHRVTNRFRKGRAFLAGDAAHIHSPAGGQGMNTGIGDAINLAWKLAAVLRGAATDRLLDTYEDERIVFARRLVATTDRVFSFVSSEGRLANFVRTRVAPVVFPLVLSFAKVRALMFRTVSQSALNYRAGPLAEGQAGKVRGGDRLPWAPGVDGDNFDTLKTMTWQVHVYGAASTELTAWCERYGLPLTVFAWQPAHQAAGLARNALYLLRPDTYVALADPSGRPTALEEYFAVRGIRPA